MFKYEVTYSCGHKEVVDVYTYNLKGRIEDLEKYGLCSECRERNENKTRAQQIIDELPMIDSLPALYGGTKEEKSWAEAIRAKWIVEGKEYLEKYHKLKDPGVSTIEYFFEKYFLSLAEGNKFFISLIESYIPLNKLISAVTNTSAIYYIENDI